MRKQKVIPGQLSFDDLMWNADSKPRMKKINPHSFRHWTNGLNTYSFWQCDKCGLIVSDENYAAGNYDHNCPGFIPHTNVIGHKATKNG